MSDRDRGLGRSMSPRSRSSSLSPTPSRYYSHLYDYYRERQHEKRYQKQLAALKGTFRGRSRSRTGTYTQEDGDKGQMSQLPRDHRYRDDRSESPRGRTGPGGYREEPLRGRLQDDDRHRDGRYESPRGRTRVRQDNFYYRQRGREEEIQIERERCHQAHVRNARAMEAERERINRVFERRIHERRRDEVEYQEDRRHEHREDARRRDVAHRDRERLEVNSSESYGHMLGEDYWRSVHLRNNRFPSVHRMRLDIPHTARDPKTPLETWEHPGDRMCDFGYRWKVPVRRDSVPRRSLSMDSRHSDSIRSITPEWTQELTPESKYSFAFVRPSKNSREKKQARVERSAKDRNIRPYRIPSRTRSPTPRLSHVKAGYRSREKEINGHLHRTNEGFLADRQARSPTPHLGHTKCVSGPGENEVRKRLANKPLRRSTSPILQASSKNAIMGARGKQVASMGLSDVIAASRAMEDEASKSYYARYRNSRRSRSPLRSLDQIMTGYRSEKKEAKDRLISALNKVDSFNSSISSMRVGSPPPSPSQVDRLLDEYTDLVIKNKELAMNASKGKSARMATPIRRTRSRSRAREQSRGKFRWDF